MGMPPDQFASNGIHGVRDLEPAFFCSNLRVKYALEQHVAELGGKRVEIAAIDRLDRLVRFLEQVWAERRVRLLTIPRTPVRRSQDLHDANEARECRGGPPGAGRCAGTQEAV